MARQVSRLAVAAAVFAAMLSGQDPRGSVTGFVVDQQGAAVPGATVTVRNDQTNTAVRLTSNEGGYFEANFLNPGPYTVTVEAAGFRNLVRSGLELQVAGRLEVRCELVVGQVTESIEVRAAAPLLDTATASGGRVIDNRQIMELPSSDNNPFTLTALAAGMQWTGAPEARRAFDNAGVSAFNTMGGVGQNEYLVDGAPVNGTGRRVGFVPPSDAVGEFKLETTSFDASYGNTTGAIVNVMSKAGTNAYHGSLYDQHYQQRWNATPHFTRLAFEDEVRQGKKKPGDPKQPPGQSNNFGATLGGPVLIPKLYNGRDKLFFFFSYNGIYVNRAGLFANRTVPQEDWKRGDFSALQAIDATRFTVYDPRSARLQGGRVVRTPFPGNRGVPVLNPVYKFYEPLYPKPNNVPGLVSREGVNNYYAGGMPTANDFWALLNRIDYNLSDRHRFFGRWYWNNRVQDGLDWTYETKRGLQRSGDTRINKGAGLDYTWAASNSTIVNAAVNWTRFKQGSIRPVQASYKPSDVGLPAYLDEFAGPNHTLPSMAIAGVETIGNQASAFTQVGTTAEAKVQLTTVKGRHSLKYGWLERRYWFPDNILGFTSGQFSFSNTYTRAADNTTTASTLGLSWAAFMMGLPTNITVDTRDNPYWSNRHRSLYLQDDLRLTSRLRANLGLRYERQGGITERFNRGLAGGFDFDYRPPFAAAAEAAYARNPLAELPAAQFRVLGGSRYLGQPDKTFTNGTHSLLPRAGLVFQLNSRTVLRGGYGWYDDVFNVNNTRPLTDGYSQTTSTVMTTDNGLTFCCGLGAVENLSASRNPMVDPFPVRAGGTRFDLPIGNALGQNIRQGRGFTFTPRDFRPAWQQRWRLGAQREISRDTVVEVSYNGSRSRIGVDQPVSFLPGQYWATGNTRNQAVDDDMQRNLANPFQIQNLAALSQSDPAAYQYWRNIGFFTGTTIRKHSLLRAYPNMNGLSGLRPGASFGDARGYNRYHDLQVQFERRMTGGFQTAVSYTRAYGVHSDYYHNEFDAAPSERPNNAVRPHRLVWSAIWEAPFGKGKRWLASGPARHIAGGWQLSWIYQYQSGPATSWGNYFYYGDISQIAGVLKQEQSRAADLHQWFDPSIAYRGTGAIPQGFTGFEGRAAMQPGAFHTRVFPTLLDALRADGIRGWDVKILRRFQLTERFFATLSFDALNATNHTNFAAPNTNPTNANFGKVTAQNGLGRYVQLNLRLDF